MPVSAEHLQQIFAEHVGRPIDRATAEAAAALASLLIDGLNTVDPEALFPIEPSTAFQAAIAAPATTKEERA